MFSYVFYHHGGSDNHGCEAIVRTTQKLLSKYSPARIYVASNAPSQDERYFITQKNIRFEMSYRLFNLSNNTLNFINVAFGRLFHKVPFLSSQMRPTLLAAKQADAVFSIGGDNYSYGRSIFLSLVDQKLRHYCKKSVLFGCSIDKEHLDIKKDRYKIENLKSFTLITARESMTYENLRKLGLQNVKLYPDPAFILPCCKNVPALFDEHKTVGINVSPLILNYEKKNKQTLLCYTSLIQYILNQTNFSIALIPHVVTKKSDDRIPLQTLYNKFKDTGRVVMVPDGNCMQLKGYISRCRMFVCARTHASIAAYSTCVPTLVVGYSVKAKGIAKDIFGTYDHYVIPVQSLKRDDDLVTAFQWLMKHENEIRSHLQKFMPSYCAKAWEAGKEIQKLIGENH
jgi:colanic acid/amylovoran biosynthesis protein